MNVKELIVKLQAIEDQEQEIYVIDYEGDPDLVDDVRMLPLYIGRDIDDNEQYIDRLCII